MHPALVRGIIDLFMHKQFTRINKHWRGGKHSRGESGGGGCVWVGVIGPHGCRIRKQPHGERRESCFFLSTSVRFLSRRPELIKEPLVFDVGVW